MELSVTIASVPTPVVQFADAVYCYRETHPIVAMVFICTLFVFTYPLAWLLILASHAENTIITLHPHIPSVNRVIFHRNLIEGEYLYVLIVIYRLIFILSTLKASARSIHYLAVLIGSALNLGESTGITALGC
jgi:hypothetical protein